MTQTRVLSTTIIEFFYRTDVTSTLPKPIRTGYFTHEAVDCEAPEIPEAAPSPEDLVKSQLGESRFEIPRSPESPERLDAIESMLIATGLDDRVERVISRPASLEEMALAHDPSYLARLEAASQGDETALATFASPDTPVQAQTFERAALSAGAVLDAVDAVMLDRFENAFCAIRPPGHHAGRATAAGFCYVNNVALGALYAKHRYGVERIAVIDFDVHHGDGTEEILADVEGVQFFSLYQWPLYPQTIAEVAPGNAHRLPLPAGATGQDVMAKIEEEWAPILTTFSPDLVFFSAGFDAHTEEKMAQLKLGEADFAALTRGFLTLARQVAGGRVVSVLEGGYNVRSLARSALAHLNTLVRFAEESATTA